MPARKPDASARAQIKLRLSREERAHLKALAADKRLSVTGLLQLLVGRELGDASLELGNRREVLKLQEATIPGGITRSRQLLDAAADAAMARLAYAEEILAHQDRQ